MVGVVVVVFFFFFFFFCLLTHQFVSLIRGLLGSRKWFANKIFYSICAIRIHRSVGKKERKWLVNMYLKTKNRTKSKFHTIIIKLTNYLRLRLESALLKTSNPPATKQSMGRECAVEDEVALARWQRRASASGDYSVGLGRILLYSDEGVGGLLLSWRWTVTGDVKWLNTQAERERDAWNVNKR